VSGTPANYTAYESHQWSKLGNMTGGNSRLGLILKVNSKVKADLRYYLLSTEVAPGKLRASLVQNPVLCVGARLGGEVEAFQSLTHVDIAVGVDFNPGERNPWVGFGDAHKLGERFKPGAFGTVFSNVLDHILDIPVFVNASHQILKPGGTLFIDMAEQRLKDDAWSVHDMIEERAQIHNQITATGFREVSTVLMRPRGYSKNAHVLMHRRYIYEKVVPA